MPNEVRTVCYDADLKIEAYRFEGIMQKFPIHFHDYYVIGFIENGRRYLLCKNQEYMINPDYSDLTVVDFSDVAQSCNTYDDYIRRAKSTRETDFTYLGIALYGSKKKINKLTGSMPLLK